jgi:hypothetical protein
MTGWRVYPPCLAAVALVGCGSMNAPTTVARAAQPPVFELGWVERSPSGLTFRVERLVVRRDGWEVTASVSDSASVSYVIQRPHRPGESMFGLVLLRTRTRAEVRELTADFRKAPPFLEPDRIDPPVPRVLAAHSSWRGKLSGSTILRRGLVVRVLFGRFVRTRGDPGYLLWVTNHAVRL